MKKTIINAIKFFIIFFVFISIFVLNEKNTVYAQSCSSVSIIERTPDPVYYDFTGDLKFKLQGTGLANGAKHKIRINCSIAANPTSSSATVSNNEISLIISPNAVARECLKISYRTGPKNIDLLSESGSFICNLGTFRTTLRPCNLSINPNVVSPGKQLTISSSDSPSEALRLFIDSAPVASVNGPIFTQTITAPSIEKTYNIILKSNDETTEYCRNFFEVKLNAPTTPPTPGPGTPTLTPTPSASSTTACGGAKDQALLSCNKCLSSKPNATPLVLDLVGEKSWTALGCIPTDPNAFVNWLLPNVIGMAGGIAFLLMLWGAFTVLTSSGNPEKLNNGKEIIVSAIAGLLIILFSVFLLRLIGFDILRTPGFG